MGPLDLDDIQGNVLRGYRCANARHIAAAIEDAAGGRALLRELLEGPGPTVTRATSWDQKPDHCLNVGVTWPGLGALGVKPGVCGCFPVAFREGAATRALAPDPDGIRGVGLGDVGPSAPENWVLGGPGTPAVHLMLSLFTDCKRRRKEMTAALRDALARHGVRELSVHDADALAGGRVHFGYRDGIAQPRITGAPGSQLADMQDEVAAGDFLLGAGHVNLYRGNHLGDVPGWLGDNGTYAAFRILEQDCAAFEATLDDWCARWDLDRELLAAKLMGRWRSGAPLTTHPDGPEPQVHEAQLNNFDYGPSAEHPLYIDDPEGHRCPVGSHIRRLNPRSSTAIGIRGSRRVIRRGMPYGPPYVPGDGIERGLIGLFLCGDLELQYEFILRVWANQDTSARGLRGTREPFLGAQPPHGGHFVARVRDARDPIVLTGLPTLTRTRGSVYCLMPGLTGLRNLGGPL